MTAPDNLSVAGLPPAIQALFQFHARVVSELNRRIEAAAALSLVQYQFLHAVYVEREPTLSAVAAALGCTRGNVTGLADRLRSLDLIRRTTNPDDRRCTLVELTEQGRQRLELARQAVSAFAAELQAGGPAAAWLGSIAEPGPTAAPSSAQSRPSSPEPGRAPRSRQVREAPAAYNTTVAAAEPVVTRGRGGEVVAVPGARDRVVVIRR